jgi:mannose-6-phosphate isomerase-like protein (cupin superfamily)
MTEEVLHLSPTQTLRVVDDTPDELLIESTWEPGGSPPPAHLHPAQDERFELREGHVTAIVDGVEHQIGPGETLEIPRGTPHKMWNARSAPATVIWRTRPGGRTADWFRTVDRLTAGATRSPAPEEFMQALAEYADVFQLVTDA